MENMQIRKGATVLWDMAGGVTVKMKVVSVSKGTVELTAEVGGKPVTVKADRQNVRLAK